MSTPEITDAAVEAACRAYHGKGRWRRKREAWDVTAEREAIRRAIQAALSAIQEQSETRGRQSGLEQAAAYHDNWAVVNDRDCENATSARRHRKYAAAIRALSTITSEIGA